MKNQNTYIYFKQFIYLIILLYLLVVVFLITRVAIVAPMVAVINCIIPIEVRNIAGRLAVL